MNHIENIKIIINIINSELKYPSIECRERMAAYYNKTIYFSARDYLNWYIKFYNIRLSLFVDNTLKDYLFLSDEELQVKYSI